MFRQTFAVIQLDHLAHNFHVLRQFVGPDVFFCPMIKANAYGHGDLDVALRLEQEGAQVLGVGLVEEGALLRQMGVKAELLVYGVMDERSLKEALHHRLTPVVNQWEQLQLLETLAVKSVAVHLKFDTGMHRLGFPWSDAKKLAEKFRSHKKVKVVGLMTHLHSAEDICDPQGKSYEQLERFSQVEKAFQGFQFVSHTLNSAGALQRPQLPKDLSQKQGVRIGLALYGYNPLKDTSLTVELKPVMSLRSQVARYHRLEAGEGVSYGYTWKAQRPSVIGIVPVGYADGYHRLLSNRGKVLFDGVEVPVVGNVCMDFINIDVTDVVRGKSLEAFAGQEVTLFGHDDKGHLLSARVLAEQAETIPYEILTSISERVPRVMQGQATTMNKLKKEVRT